MGNPQLGAENGLMQGDVVEFQVGRDEKNANGVHAVRVKLLQSSSMPPPMFAPGKGVASGSAGAAAFIGQTLTGQVRSFRDDFGFATSPLFSGDIFVGANSNPHLPRSLQEGDRIKFTVERNGSKGEACNVSLGGHGGQSARDRSRSPYPSALGGPWGGQNVASKLGKTVTGTVRSFKGNWGFAVSQSFDGDVFVGMSSNSHLEQDLRVGDKIRFCVQNNGGKVEATNVQVIGHGEAPVKKGPHPGGKKTDAIHTVLTAAIAARGGKATPKAGRPQSNRRAGSRDPTDLVGKDCVGIVRTFKGSWGFATSQTFDGDVFVGKGSNPQLTEEMQQGQRIRFKIGIGTSGKPEAQQVRLL